MELFSWRERYRECFVALEEIHALYPEALVMFDSQLPHFAAGHAYFRWNPKRVKGTGGREVPLLVECEGRRAGWHVQIGVWVRLTVGVSTYPRLLDRDWVVPLPPEILD